MIDSTHEEAVNNFEDFRCQPSQERLAREGPAAVVYRISLLNSS